MKILKREDDRQRIEDVKTLRSKFSLVCSLAGDGGSGDAHLLLEVDRQKKITDPDIMDVAKKASSEWKSIARRLPNVLRPGELAFKLGTSTLKKIEKEHSDDDERLIESLVQWRAMSPQHNWGLLWDTLHQCGHGTVAAEVLKPSLRGKPNNKCS